MTIEKRKRGRPVGSCKDDSPLLARVADILLLSPKLKPTTAIKRVLALPDPSPIRRLQSKWKQGGSNYLQQANARAQLKSTEAVSTNRLNGTARRLKWLREEIKFEELLASNDSYDGKFRKASASLNNLRRELMETKQMAEFEKFQETAQKTLQLTSMAFEKRRNGLTDFELVRRSSRVHR
jgi:hypothetical protein